MEIYKKHKKVTDTGSISPLDSVVRIGKKTAISREEDVEIKIPGPSYITEFSVGGFPCVLLLSEGAVTELRMETQPEIKTVQELVKNLKAHE